MKEKQRLSKIWQSSQYPTNKSASNRATKELKNLIIKNKNEILQDYLSKLTSQGNNEHSPLKMCSTPGPEQIKKSPKLFHNTWKIDLIIFLKPVQIPKTLKLKYCYLPQHNYPHKFNFFSTKEVKKLLKNKRKSPRYDLITIELLKNL